MVDRDQRGIEPVEHHLDGGKHAQHSGIARIALNGSAQQPGGISDPAAAQQQLGRVHRRAVVVRHQLDRAQCQRESAVDLAGRRQRAAGVAIAFSPVGRQCDQALIGRGRFAVAAAIAEQPGAKL
jgi:hypothetical protein